MRLYESLMEKDEWTNFEFIISAKDEFKLSFSFTQHATNPNKYHSGWSVYILKGKHITGFYAPVSKSKGMMLKRTSIDMDIYRGIFTAKYLSDFYLRYLE